VYCGFVCIRIVNRSSRIGIRRRGNFARSRYRVSAGVTVLLEKKILTGIANPTEGTTTFRAARKRSERRTLDRGSSTLATARHLVVTIVHVRIYITLFTI